MKQNDAVHRRDELIREACRAAGQRLAGSTGPDLALIATGELLFWIVAADDSMLRSARRGYAAYRNDEDNDRKLLMQGLRYPRNVLAHEAEAWGLGTSDAYVDVYTDTYGAWTWTNLTAPPPGAHDHVAAQHVAYEQRLGRVTRDHDGPRCFGDTRRVLDAPADRPEAMVLGVARGRRNRPYRSGPWSFGRVAATRVVGRGYVLLVGRMFAAWRLHLAGRRHVGIWCCSGAWGGEGVVGLRGALAMLAAIAAVSSHVVAADVAVAATSWTFTDSVGETYPQRPYVASVDVSHVRVEADPETVRFWVHLADVQPPQDGFYILIQMWMGQWDGSIGAFARDGTWQSSGPGTGKCNATFVYSTPEDWFLATLPRECLPAYGDLSIHVHVQDNGYSGWPADSVPDPDSSMATLGPMNLGDAPPDVWPPARRIAGDDRTATAIAAAHVAYRDGADTAVLARADDFADALAGGPYAVRESAALLLTERDQVPEAVLDAFRSLGVSNVVLLGGAAAISRRVADHLRGLGYSVSRIAGQDRYETAARLLPDPLPTNDDRLDLLVATGENFPDAVASGTISATPIGLTSRDTLPRALADRIADGTRRNIMIVGGTTAIAAGVESGIEMANGGRPPSRRAGSDRYDTSRNMATLAANDLLAENGVLVVTSGANFPDALAAGPLSDHIGAPLLLVPPDHVPPPTREFLTRYADVIESVWVVGGPAAVNEATLNEIRATLAEAVAQPVAAG